jgi:hypothetical protein
VSREAAEKALQQVLPGCLPSGWTRLAGKVLVWREDGTPISMYAGHGLKVAFEGTGTKLDRTVYTLSVSRRDGAAPSESDLDKVRTLFLRMRRALQMKHMLFTRHQQVAKHTVVL